MENDSAPTEDVEPVKHGNSFKKDLTGRVFGRLTVISFSDMRLKSNGRRGSRWNCRCECGKTKVVRGDLLKSGDTKSCGCLMPELASKRNLTHGHATKKNMSRTYQAYKAMLQRCTNPNNDRYSSYGGRGIKVCERWLSGFEFYLSDMGEVPSGMTADRIDNNGNYEPGNVRWASKKVQSRNKRTTHFLTINGETLCVKAWSERSGISCDTIHGRLRKGWDAKRAVFEPVT